MTPTQLRNEIDALPIDVAVLVADWSCGKQRHMQVTTTPDLMFADQLIELLIKSGAKWEVLHQCSQWTTIQINMKV